MPEAEVNRIRYFTALIKRRADDPDAPNRQQLYIRALQTIPRLSIIHGRFKDREDQYPQYPFAYGGKDGSGTARPLRVQIVRSEEKGTDVNLATHLLMDCFNDDFEQAVVISNDSDLALPVRMVRDQFNKPVITVNPQRGAKRGVWEMRRASTVMIHRINASVLERCQFPDPLADAGGTFPKPRHW